jgi:hypothetical protein
LFRAIQSLILLEGNRMPRRIWEPAAGNGAIVIQLQASGRFVVTSDIFDYGLPGCGIFDYLTTPMLRQVEGIVTNPPFRLARRFAEKRSPKWPISRFSCGRISRWMARRGQLLDGCEPPRVWLSAQRLPFMHRNGWTCKKSTTTHRIAGSSTGAVRRASSRSDSIGRSCSGLRSRHDRDGVSRWPDGQY